MNFIWTATNKSIPRFPILWLLYDICTTFLCHLWWNYQYSTWWTLSWPLQILIILPNISLWNCSLFYDWKECINTIYYWYIYQSRLSENKWIRLTIGISGVHKIPWLFLPGRFFIIVWLSMVLTINSLPSLNNHIYCETLLV